MIKIIKAYKNSRVLENGILNNIGLGVKTDNKADLLRFEFDEFIDGNGILLTDLKDDEGQLIGYPLTKVNNGYELEVDEGLTSQNKITIQLEITNGEVVWHSLMATLEVKECLEVGLGDMPTTVENWIANANITLEELEDAIQETENLDVELSDKTDGSQTLTITYKDGTTKEGIINDGIGLDYDWQGTSLGVKREDEGTYIYTNLQGPKGEAGAIKMLIVAELPETGADDTIYLVPITPDTSGNNYAEYIYINGAWELLGKIGVQVDLTDYVKNTDYATSSKGGVVKVSIGTYGFTIDSNGNLRSEPLTYANYLTKTNYYNVDKGTLENVITGKGLVSNTDYGNSTTGGVIKGTGAYSFTIDGQGRPYANALTMEQYETYSTNNFISKGTLDNVLNAKIGSIDSVLDTINGEII